MLRPLFLDRRLIAALVALAALASPFAASARADVAQVTVVSPGGVEQTLSLDALAGSEDVVARPYALRSSDGESTQTVTGFSLAALLDAAGADPYGFSYLEVQRPAGGAVLLSRDQALDAGAFPDGPATIYATASGTGFLRPSTGPEDANAGDCFEAPQGISLVLRKGSRLRVRARASTLRTRPGQPVQFSAVVEQAGSGEQLSYSWYFDDGHSAAAAKASHGFAKRGSYDVVVGVTSGSDDSGASAVVTVQVGAPLGGPNRKGGGENDNAEAPDHGAAAGPSAGAGTGVGGAAPSATSTPAPAPASPTPTPQAEQKAEAPPTPPGERVVGELIGASSNLPPPAAKQAAARSGQLQGDGGGGGIPGAAWGLLASAGLFGAGALIEAGGIARLWPRGRLA